MDTFWMSDYGKSVMHTRSEIDRVLEKSNPQLEDLFEVEELLQQCSNKNQTLLEFLERPENIKKLIQYITRASDENIKMVTKQMNSVWQPNDSNDSSDNSNHSNNTSNKPNETNNNNNSNDAATNTNNDNNNNNTNSDSTESKENNNSDNNNKNNNNNSSKTTNSSDSNNTAPLLDPPQNDSAKLQTKQHTSGTNGKKRSKSGRSPSRRKKGGKVLVYNENSDLPPPPPPPGGPDASPDASPDAPEASDASAKASETDATKDNKDSKDTGDTGDTGDTAATEECKSEDNNDPGKSSTNLHNSKTAAADATEAIVAPTGQTDSLEDAADPEIPDDLDVLKQNKSRDEHVYVNGSIANETESKENNNNNTNNSNDAPSLSNDAELLTMSSEGDANNQTDSTDNGSEGGVPTKIGGDPLSEIEKTQIRLKYPYLASEILNCQIPGILDAVLDRKNEYLDLLFDFIEKDAPLDAVLTNYWRSCIVGLVRRNSSIMLEYIKTRSNVLKYMVKHIRDQSIMELVIALGWDPAIEELKELDDVADWMYEEGLVPKLIAMLSAEHSSDEHSAASYTLVDIVAKTSRSTNLVLFRNLSSEDQVNSLMLHMFENNRSSLLESLSVLLALLHHYPNARAERQMQMESGFTPMTNDSDVPPPPPNNLISPDDDSSDDDADITPFSNESDDKNSSDAKKEFPEITNPLAAAALKAAKANKDAAAPESKSTPTTTDATDNKDKNSSAADATDSAKKGNEKNSAAAGAKDSKDSKDSKDAKDVKDSKNKPVLANEAKPGSSPPPPPPGGAAGPVDHLGDESHDLVKQMFSNPLAAAAAAGQRNSPDRSPIMTPTASDRAANDFDAKEVDALPSVVRVVCDKLEEFKGLLETAPTETLQLPFCTLSPPLGPVRHKIIDMIVALMRTPSNMVSTKLRDLKFIQLCINLFFQYPWNNLLHGSVEHIVQMIVSGDCAILKRALFEDCRFLDRILEARETSKTHHASHGFRLGFMGHLTRIANTIVEFSKRNQMLHNYMNENDGWMEFIEGELRLENQKLNTQLGGHRPSALDDGVDDEFLFNLSGAQNANETEDTNLLGGTGKSRPHIDDGLLDDELGGKLKTWDDDSDSDSDNERHDGMMHPYDDYNKTSSSSPAKTSGGVAAAQEKFGQMTLNVTGNDKIGSENSSSNYDSDHSSEDEDLADTAGVVTGASGGKGNEKEKNGKKKEANGANGEVYRLPSDEHNKDFDETQWDTFGQVDDGWANFEDGKEKSGNNNNNSNKEQQNEQNTQSGQNSKGNNPNGIATELFFDATQEQNKRKSITPDMTEFDSFGDFGVKNEKGVDFDDFFGSQNDDFFGTKADDASNKKTVSQSVGNNEKSGKSGDKGAKGAKESSNGSEK